MSEATLTRSELATLIVERLRSDDGAKRQFPSSGPVRYAVVDDLLPLDVARRIGACFPDHSEMVRNKKLREDKYVSAQLNKHHPLIEESVYSFQDRRVLDAVQDITGVSNLDPDENLYAGGISSMERGQYLEPHLDNSHDKDRQRWRVLNLLYYVTEGWDPNNGGNLELWPDGPRGRSVTIPSLFNRLVIMETHERSWHSVNPITGEGARKCVSNYYFRSDPLHADERYHVTTFRARPGHYLRDIALRADTFGRRLVRKVVGTKIIENPHVYKRDDDSDSA